MATQALMPVEEYLRKHFEREPEYRDGILEERPLPNFLHSLLQAFFIHYLSHWTESDTLTAAPELRVKLRSGRFVLPDICIFEGAPTDKLPSAPPLVVIEILSPDDSMSELLAKLGEYREWGAANIWVVNTETRTLQLFDGAELQPVSGFTLPAYDIVIPQEEVFRKVNARFPQAARAL